MKPTPAQRRVLEALHRGGAEIVVVYVFDHPERYLFFTQHTTTSIRATALVLIDAGWIRQSGVCNMGQVYSITDAGRAAIKETSS